MDRLRFLNALLAVGISLPVGTAMAKSTRRIAGIALPDTRSAREAEAIAKAVLPAEIYNHSLRTFLFAELVAKVRKIDHDVEVVYVASLLHDTGMSPKYMSDPNPFEVDGANIARDVITKNGGA